MKKNYNNSWNNILEKEFQKDYFQLIESFIEAEK
jgi:uracil DNA glycosylase